MTHHKAKITDLAAVLAGFVCLATVALASPISVAGTVWAGATAYPNNLATTPPAGTPTATFTVSNSSANIFNFYSSTDNDLTSFLTNGGTNGNVITYLTGGDLNNVSEGCSVTAGATCGINNAVIEFTGSTYMVHGASYNVIKDDAAYLVIDGVSVLQNDSVNDSAAELDPFTWTGATGTYNFDLLYQEVNGAPAELESDIKVTPEPGSLFLVGTGLLMFAGLVRRSLQA
jgi:hypothetical protein